MSVSSSMSRRNSKERGIRRYSRSRSQERICYICRGQGHTKYNCPTKDAVARNEYGYKMVTCDRCKGQGHMSKDHKD